MSYAVKESYGDRSASIKSSVSFENNPDRSERAYRDQYDEQLLTEIVKRNRMALETLYDRYASGVYSIAKRMLSDSGAAEEVTQDVFFKVWTRASSYDTSRGAVMSWLFTIARNRTIDETRRRKKRWSKLLYGFELTEIASDHAEDPVVYAQSQMDRGQIKDALSLIKVEQRQVIVLSYFGGLTHTEIAQRLGYPLGTVKTRMRLGIKKLREVLDSQIKDWESQSLQ